MNGMSSTLERYQFIRELGAGAMGRVSLAMQAGTSQLVAVKRLHEMIALTGGARLRREFRSLSQIQHKNVVRVIELGEENAVPFLVMEFVRGQDLSDWLGTRPSFSEITRIFVGIADALSAVHAQGVIHRDLKPENIRVTDQGEAKLMDFGLAKTLEGSVALTKAGAMVGTALYMAPEQCRGAQLDYRADLYALGAVLYWALVGQPPFVGDSIVQVIMQHLQQAPVPPSTHNPDVPEALEKLCLTLLSKNPNDRPSSASSVRDALMRALEAPSAHAAMSVTMSVSVAYAARADALLIAPLVGREAEFESLSALFEAGIDGLHAVVGDVGTGKTRLLRALAERAQNSGARLGLGEAVSNDPTPYGAIKRLIDSLEKHYRFVFDEVSSAAQTELARIASQFGRATAPDPGLPLEVARLRLFEAFTELLERISKLTVIALENLHWADESTLALLAHALRAAPSARVIITYRLEDLPEGLNAPKGFPKPKKTIALAAMPDDQMRQFLRIILGGDIEPALETELIGHAGGNPWVLEERLKAMLESGAVKRRANVFEWNRSLTRLPESLSELLAHRLTALETGALEFARAASVLGRNFQFEDAKQMLEWDDDTALDALETLTRARLVAEVPGGNGELFRFTHPSYVELLRNAIMRLKRKRLHAKAAQLLTTKSGVEPLEIAEHWYNAEDYIKAAPQSFDAGQTAQIAFAHPQAERAYRLALDSVKQLDEDRQAEKTQQMLAMRTKHHLAEVLSFTGQTAEAQMLWREVIEQTRTLADDAELLTELSAKAKVALVRLLRYSGAVETALEIIGEPRRGEPLYTRLCAELCTLFRGKNQHQSRHYGLEALVVGKREQDHEGMALALIGLASSNEPPARKIALANLAIGLAEKTQNQHLLAIAWNELGTNLYAVMRDHEAYQAWKRAAQFAEVTRDLKILGGLEINMALVQMQEADFAEAQISLERAAAMMRRMNLGALEKHSVFNIACCKYAQNQLLEARQDFERVRDHERQWIARVWEARITFELGDGFVTELPSLEFESMGYGVWRLTQAQMALSFGDYSKAWSLTTEPNLESDWHWALIRVHAGWRLGYQDQMALKRVLDARAADPTLSEPLIQEYAEFVRLVLSEWSSTTRARLDMLAAQYATSPIGLLARDVTVALRQ